MGSNQYSNPTFLFGFESGQIVRILYDSDPQHCAPQGFIKTGNLGHVNAGILQ
jgi:hypothetical protein